MVLSKFKKKQSKDKGVLVTQPEDKNANVGEEFLGFKNANLAHIENPIRNDYIKDLAKLLKRAGLIVESQGYPGYEEHVTKLSNVLDFLTYTDKTGVLETLCVNSPKS